MSAILIKSQNVRGLVDDRKRREVFHKFNKSKFNVFLLQETHIYPECEQQRRAEFGGDIYFSHGTRSSRGTCILFKKNLGKTVHNSQIDTEGRYVILDVEFGDTRVTLAAIYGPNSDDSDFFLDLLEQIECIENDNRIVGGDWNIVLDIAKDKRGGLQQTHKSSLNIINNWMEETDLIDIWRLMNPNEFRFTWKRSNPSPGIFCRLDYFLVSFGLIDKINKCDIVPGFKSDHSAVILAVASNDNPRGPGFWRLNCSYLSDSDYAITIKKTIAETIEFNQDSDPLLLWDTIKCQIRGASIKFSSNKKKSKVNKIQVLEKRINGLEKELGENNSEEVQSLLANTKAELEEYISEATKGAMIRARVQWYEEGEKNSKYFINLEKRNHNNKTINSLELRNGTITNEPNEILNHQKQFYKNLYSSNPITNSAEAADTFVNGLQIPKISEDLKSQTESPISESELLLALKDLPNGKSPGIDGLPSEFYKAFWNDLKDHYLKALQQAYDIKNMSITQRQGSIVLIPKKDKNPLLLKNWRPLSLMNCDYKILAKAIANRIKSCLQNIIHSDQTGFMKNRFIGENIVKILNIIEIAENEQIPALIMAVDFEKAFDHLEWHFIIKSLELFNFSPTIIQWVETLYKNISSCVGNNGWFSDFFPLSRGVRQGCPLSPYLFIICTELMAISVRSNPQIKGVRVNGEETKLSQFADDTTFILLYDADTLNAVIQTLDSFHNCSGLKINYEKTELLRIGSMKHSLAKLYTQKDLKWTDGTILLLGIKICHDLDETLKLNYSSTLAKIRDLIRIWQARKLTLFGKVTIIQTLLISQIIYRLSVLPSPKKEMTSELEKYLLEFLWNNKKHYLDQNIIKLDLEKGGIRMVDFKLKSIALKTAWVKRMHSSLDANWKAIAKYFLPENALLFWSGNVSQKHTTKLLQHYSKFWDEVALAWSLYNFHTPDHIRDILSQQIWYNSFILVKDLPVFRRILHSAGITFLKDIIDDNYDLSCNYIIRKYNIPTKYIMLVNEIVSAIPNEWKQKIKQYRPNLEFEIRNSNLQQAISQPKISKFIYIKLVNNKIKFEPTNLVAKWSADLATTLSVDHIHEAFQLIKTSTLSPKHRDFQFRLIHRVLVTNRSLKLWKIKDSENCTLCNVESETICHLLWDCTHSKLIWNMLFNWINEKTQINITYSKKEVLLGIANYNMQFLNCLFLITKQYLYACRCLDEKPNFGSLESKIKYYISVEKYIAIKNGKVDHHQTKWAMIN